MRTVRCLGASLCRGGRRARDRRGALRAASDDGRHRGRADRACPTPSCARAGPASSARWPRTACDLAPGRLFLNLVPAARRKSGEMLDLPLALAAAAAAGHFDAQRAARRDLPGRARASTGACTPCRAGSRRRWRRASAAIARLCRAARDRGRGGGARRTSRRYGAREPGAGRRARAPARARSSARRRTDEDARTTRGRDRRSTTCAGSSTRSSRSRRRRPADTRSCSSGRRARARACSRAGSPRLLPPPDLEERLDDHARAVGRRALARRARARAAVPRAAPHDELRRASSAAARPRRRARSRWRTAACCSSTSCPSSAARCSRRCAQPIESGHGHDLARDAARRPARALPARRGDEPLPVRLPRPSARAVHVPADARRALPAAHLGAAARPHRPASSRSRRPSAEELLAPPVRARASTRRRREARARARACAPPSSARARDRRGTRNADLDADELDAHAALDARARTLARPTRRRARALSARAVQSLRRVARTCADLDGEEPRRAAHVAQALALRAPIG